MKVMLRTAWEAIVRFLFAASLQQRATNAVEMVDTVITTDDVAKDAVARSVSRQRVKRPAELSSMRELLENIDETFSALRMPFDKLSWVHRCNVAGLKKLGVHVVHSDGIGRVDTIQQADRILPAMICVSYGLSKKDDDDRMYPAVFFAIKQKKLPAEVSKCEGQHFLFGMGFKADIDKKAVNKKLFWVSGFITVRSDGTAHLHHELRARNHTIKISNPAARRASGRTLTYTTKSWGKASLAEMYEEKYQGEGERVCIENFIFSMNWWIAREERWSVAVKKDGERITFSVPKELTARFFKDRIKITNENGETKRIIHYVNSHERVMADRRTIVKEHIRGLSEFYWKGYSCYVTAPKFNGYLSTEFNLEGDELEEEEGNDEVEWIDMSKVGMMLADREEGLCSKKTA